MLHPPSPGSLATALIQCHYVLFIGLYTSRETTTLVPATQSKAINEEIKLE